MMLLYSTIAYAQDVIVKKDGSTVVCLVVELNETEIVYKKWSNLNGSNYVMDRSLASAINYQNGKKVNLSGTTNLYKPNNQNDGVRQFNDRALLNLDKASQSVKAKKLRNTGLFVVIPLIGAGLGLGIISAAVDSRFFEDIWPVSAGVVGCGAIWTTYFLIASNHEKKKAQMLEISSIYQYDFKLSNRNTLSADLDMISDNLIGKRTLGLGLRYNF